jgi:hypothetical protein
MSLSGKWRWLVYILVGVCLVIAVSEFSMRYPRWKPTAIEKNLLSAFFSTVVLFGYVLRWGWKYRRIPTFWLAFAAFASIHCSVFAVLSFCVAHWSAFVLGPVVGVEAVAMAAFILWAIKGKRT